MNMMRTRAAGSCMICGSPKVHYRFSIDEYRVEECGNCKLMRLSPQPSDDVLGKIYGEGYFIFSEDESAALHASQLKASTARDYLDSIADYAGGQLRGSLLEIGCGQGDFLCEAAQRGLTVTGLEYSPRSAAVAARRIGGRGEIIVGEIDVLAGTGRAFDFIVFADVLEHVRDPRAFLRHVHALLSPGGIAVAICPSLDSASARWMGASWVEFKIEHLWYYSKSNISRLLYSEGFAALKILPARKTLSLDYIVEHFVKYPVQPFSALLKQLRVVLPQKMLRAPLKVTASGILVMARRIERREPRILSVVMAAYNEAPTIRSAIERVLAKRIDGVEIELIIVESNSKDGTRDIVRSYEGRDRVRIAWQDAPKGKGNAVREGLALASGDFILIQDADDEYDIEDYDVLLEPLLSGEATFVLGARHGGGSWKMRQFSGQPVVSVVFNFGHWFFATLINVLFWQSMKDPFTMYKVFRADCLNGLTFQCNRFDFDHELVIKLACSGHVPLEVPVNYRSRSFADGKKINSVRDPLTWLATIFRLRFRKW